MLIGTTTRQAESKGGETLPGAAAPEPETVEPASPLTDLPKRRRRSYQHRINSVRAQDDANWQANWATYACGYCAHGGGTLQKTKKEDGAPFPYRHTNPKHCAQYHIPKRLMVGWMRLLRRLDSTAKQNFNSLGRTERKPRPPKKKKVA